MESCSTPLSPPVVLSFAASDPSGGAGVHADLMTRPALGCDALWQKLAAGFRPGMGPFIPDRFFRTRRRAENNE